MDGYFTTLGGRILNLEKEVSGLGSDDVQEVVFNGRLRGEAVRGDRCGTLKDWQGSGEWSSGGSGWSEVGQVWEFLRTGRGWVGYGRGALGRPNWS